MVPVPPSSRQQLEWSIFRRDEEKDDEWVLVLRPFYAELFADRCAELLSKSARGWVESKSGRARLCRFHRLQEEDLRLIEAFLRDYSRIVVIGLNRHISGAFENELDSCIALDFRAERGKGEDEERTAVGQLVYRAKYLSDSGACNNLVDELARGFQRIPRLDTGVGHRLTFIPTRPGKGRDLPRELVERLAERLQGTGVLSDDEPIVYPELVIDKPEFKNLTSERKHEVWGWIYSHDAVLLRSPVVGQRIVIVDDLYQSGNTIWSYAGFLKAQGASAVHGLACVKTMRDSDNQ